MVDESLLRERADRGVRLIALSLLADARAASEELAIRSRELRDGDGESDDALHDFRVAVRRLRSWLRAFKPQLRDAVSPKQRRRLSEIADATGAIRDATVHLEWLRTERRGMGVRQRVGGDWLRRRLETQRKDGSGAAVEASTDLEAMMPRLARRLSVYRAAVIDTEPSLRFGALLAERIRKEGEELRETLAAIHTYADVDEAHRARIAAKRLRYVVEPVSDLVTGGDAIIETLKALQDSLGDLHDVHVFASEVDTDAAEAAKSPSGPGLLRLGRRLQERGARAYAGIEHNWSHGAGSSFFDRVETLAADLEHRSSTGCRTD